MDAGNKKEAWGKDNYAVGNGEKGELLESPLERGRGVLSPLERGRGVLSPLERGRGVLSPLERGRGVLSSEICNGRDAISCVSTSIEVKK